MGAVVAAATPPGRGALAVVRLTGPDTARVLRRLLRPRSGWPLPHGRARRVQILDGEQVFDDGLVCFFEGPRSATGEDLAEIGCHGNPLVVERLVRAAVAAGARLAGPGEFTRRALLNGKVDLLGAEAVLQVAEASTEAGVELARAGVDGRLGEALAELRARLLEVGAELEARLDHPGDALALKDDAGLQQDLLEVARRCEALAASYPTGRVLVHGARVALVGPVNAGKSSLFNALLGRPRALVHETPGTTRDVLEVQGVVGDLPVVLLDTAGERQTDDPVEAAGLALARELVEEADLLLVVVRARPEGLDPVERAILSRTTSRRRLLVYNGVDRPGVAPAPEGALPTVAPTGTGVQALVAAVQEALLARQPRPDELVIASVRQRDLLQAVAARAEEAAAELPLAGPAVAADGVVGAVEELDALTGADSREAVLDALFARFCIGK